MSDWKQYYENLEGRDVRGFFLEALDNIELTTAEPVALDLGCGDGAESLYLLEHGWQVNAVDAEAAAVQQLLKKCDVSLRTNLKIQVSLFHKAKLPDVDFVYAGLSLPFCAPDIFELSWQHIVQSMKTGCVFAGHFYGVHDDWAQDPNMTFLVKEEVQALFEGFDVSLFCELEEDTSTVLGYEKHWHYFEVIAKKQ